MKLLKYLLPLVAAFAVISCSEETLAPQSNGLIDNGDTFTADISLNVAEMNATSSRAFSDKPDYANLKLYVLEFRYNPNSTIVDCEMIQKYVVENETVNADGDIHFTLTLNKTHEPRVLHFIAVPKGTNLNVPYGLEGVVIPPIAVGERTPAYWQRVTFPNGYAHYTTDKLNGDEQNSVLELNDDTEGKLTHVPMLCNFAKITVTTAETVTGYTFGGFSVCNQPMHGYIAPWDAEASSFPDFLEENGKLKTYAQINGVYKGRTHEFDNPIIENTENEFSTDPQYLYERTVTSLHNPFIIVRLYKGGNPDAPRYYKLDLGHLIKDENSPQYNMFEYYDVLRNFDYQVNITGVESDGYSSVSEAMDGVVYNNFSFDITTKSMLNVSNGVAMLWVDKTTIVVTSAAETEQTLAFRYTTDLNSGTYNTNQIELLYYKEGEAIAETISDDKVDNGWRTITFKTVNPTMERKMQEFIVYNKDSGLGRIITVIVRNPWECTNCMVWGGNYNTLGQFMAVADVSNATTNTPAGTLWNKGWENKVSSTEWSSTAQQSITLTFRIEDNIPEAMFPLDFIFESDRQNIENNKLGDLTVQYNEKSLFDTQTSNLNRIQFVKTVTWADYNSELTFDNQRGAIVTADDGTKYRVVRGRFLTNETILKGQESRMRVYNPYMREKGSDKNYLEVTFTGVEGVAPNFPITNTLTPSNAAAVTHPE